MMNNQMKTAILEIAGKWHCFIFCSSYLSPEHIEGVLSLMPTQVGASFDLNENPSYGSSRSKPQANIEGESEMIGDDGNYEVIDHAQ